MNERRQEDLIAALEARASRRAALAAMGLAGAGITLVPAAAAATVAAVAEAPVEEEKGKNRCHSCCDDGSNRLTVLQFLHAAPGQGPVDIWLEGLLFFESVPFGSTTGLTRMPNYQFTVTVTEPGAGLLAPIFEQEIKLEKCTATEFAIVGAFGLNGDMTPPATGIAYPIDREPTGKKGAARFNAVHLAMGAPAVDIVTGDGKMLARNIGYGTSSAPRLMRRGVYELQVRVAGTSEVVLTLPKVEMLGGRSSQVHVMGAASGGSKLSALNLRYVNCCTRTGGKRRKKK
jgi:hypothetical protein